MPKFLTEAELNALLPQWMDAVKEFSARFREIELHRSALLVIDMQNDFLLDTGILPTWGGQTILPRLRRLIELYRHTGRPVIYTRHCYSQPEIDGGTTTEWWRMDRDSPVLREGLPGSEIHHDLAPTKSDLVIIKRRYSAFHNTNLASLLRRLNVRDVIISGVASNCCCAATAHDALFHDFHVFFLADGCGGSDEFAHRAALRDIACFYGTVMTCEDVGKLLRDYNK